MKKLTFTHFYVFLLIGLLTLTGCERTRKTAVGIIPAETDKTYIPVKSIWLIDYPEGDKDAYLTWVASVAPTLQAPPEVLRIRSYDNINEEISPHRLVAYEFGSFLDAVSYMSRPEIVAILDEIPNRTKKAEMHTFIQRSDYAKEDEGDWPIKGVYLINYPVGGKQAYLDWVASISDTLVDPIYVKAIRSYDNYYGATPNRLVKLEFASEYGATPNRLVEFEFASEEDGQTYSELEAIKAIDEQLDIRTDSWVSYDFELRSDYIKE